MKRSLLLLTLLFALLAPSHAQFRWGVKGGINLEKIRIESDWKDLVSSNSNVGFQVGPMVEMLVPGLGLGFDAALMYSQTGYSVINGQNTVALPREADFINRNIDIPVHAKWRFGAGVFSFFVLAGPYASFNLGNDGGFDLKNIDKTKVMWGANLGGGLELFTHLQISATYGLGFSDNWKADLDNPIDWISSKTGIWQINAAWLF